MNINLFRLISILLLLSMDGIGQDPNWGLIVNPKFESETIKSTLFFTGNWRNGIQFYDYNPSDNTGLFTMHPADARHLGWSENQSNRDFAVDWMVEAGINIINMSYWGLPGTDNWAYWAPLQSSSQSHDELFDAVLGKDILIAPFIESYAATDAYDGFSFADDFPGTTGNPSPQLAIQIEDLIDRYILHPENSQWTEKWARVFDRDGIERYLVSIIHVASNKSGITHQEFAQGFDILADQIYENTNVRVGFALDILPPNSYAPGLYKATPVNNGTFLSQQSSVLALQCFIPEIWQGVSNENLLIQWKAEFSSAWIETGIPWVHDISSGYDAHIVFPTSPVYGNNQHWRFLQDSLIAELNPSAFAFNAWNGYTEGFAGLPSLQYGHSTYNWICELFGGNCWDEPDPPTSFKTEKDVEQVSIFPNPVRDQLTINFTNTDINKGYLRIFSLSNHLLISKEILPGSVDRSMHLDISDLPSGIYLLYITCKSGHAVEHLVVLP